jgi:hypothetical protein
MLFHGPGVRGRFSSESPLRVDTARDICSQAQFGGSGEWVLGPLDDATRDALDALLKLLEEHDPSKKWMLWAYDLGLVPKTIRSRMDETVFLPPPEGEPELAQEMADLGFALVRAALARDVAFIYQKVHAVDQEQVPELLVGLENALTVLPGAIQLWPSLRSLGGQITRPTPWQVLAALCFG